MVVKIRFSGDAAVERTVRRHAPFVSGLGSLVILMAVSCLLLAMWRLTSDLGWTDTFVISEGLLSHWQVWMALTIGFGLVASRLGRYGRRMELAEEAALAGDTLETAPVTGPADIGTR